MRDPILRQARRRAARAVAAALFGCVSAACVRFRVRPLADLPAIEYRVPVQAPLAMAIQLTGDAGRGAVDRHVADALAHAGVAVTSLSSLSYFWHRKDPDRLAADLARLIERVAPAARNSRLVLVGFSQGADVLPFAFNRLPVEVRARVALLLAINPAADAVFAFHIPHWWNHIIGPTEPTLPEFATAAAAGVSIVCIYARKDADAACPQLPAGASDVVALAGGHEFGGDYAGLVAAVATALAGHGVTAAAP
jgi:type IV secretory pathway VirJ component